MIFRDFCSISPNTVQVNVNLAIRSMGPVDENSEVFSLDCYFRQTWTDTRLV
jgi:gamma-aminobutyric acid receptor subunit alpha